MIEHIMTCLPSVPVLEGDRQESIPAADPADMAASLPGENFMLADANSSLGPRRWICTRALLLVWCCAYR